MGGQGLPSMMQTAFGGQQQVNPMLMQTSYGGGYGGNPMLMRTSLSMPEYKEQEFNRLMGMGVDPTTAAKMADKLTRMDRFNNYGMPRFEKFTRGLGGIADTVFQGLYMKRLLENMKNEKDPSELVPTGLKGFDTYSNVGDFGIGNLDPMLVEGAQYVNQSPDMAGKGNKVITAKYGGMVDKYMGGGIIDQYKHGGSHDGMGDITPAMLEPGEFVLTRDAVKGAGGPEVLYPLMAQLEARA